MGFLHPELLLLFPPALFVWWRARERGLVRALRLAVIALLVLALAGIYVHTSSPGRDVVVVVDRSRSMTAEAARSGLELVALAEDERGEGDRVGVVALGARAEVERLPAPDGRFTGFERDVAADGTDLSAGIAAALELVPRGRSGRILLVTDGEENAGDAVAAARRAFARGVPIDVHATPRPPIADLSVDDVELPEEVAVGEPFQFAVWVRSERRVEADFVLERRGVELARGRRVFEPGVNRLVFRDVLGADGVADYRVRLSSEDDRRPENDVGLGAVRARGSASVLVLNEDGAEDTLVATLRAAGLPVAVATPESAPLDRVSLTAWRAIVLENVAAERLAGALDGLTCFVRERGGGLLVTGGKASFGVGGYHRSALDPLLPVSMELRQEHRKLAIALAIVMDRSGSMAAPVADGITKMDLANLGAAASIELLSPMDSVGVIAVDSAAHVVQKLTSAENRAALISTVRRIRSEGGGIYVRTALLAAASMLDAAPQQNRHVTLFSDAADSEEQGGVPELLEKMGKMGITVSVIALGSRADSDARFLEEVGRAGGGDVYFTQSPAELPRLFAQDTLKMSRSTFVEEPTGTALLAGMFGIGELEVESFPSIAGYNLTYLRPGAVAAAATTDEYAAPLVAYSYQGLGRTAVYTGQIGGSFGADVVTWPGFASFFTTLARWLVGQEEPADFHASVVREGATAIVSVDVAPDAVLAPGAAGLTARIEAADGSVRELVLERAGPDRYEARYPIEHEGIALGTLALSDGRFLTLPPIALPYSPEFEPTLDPRRGERLLARIARESGGRVGASVADVFSAGESGRAWRTLGRELALAALCLFLLEIAVRRLGLFARGGVPVRLPAGAERALRGLRNRARGARRVRHPATSPHPPPDAAREPEPPPHAPAAPSPDAADGSEGSNLAATLARARRAADRENRR